MSQAPQSAGQTRPLGWLGGVALTLGSLGFLLTLFPTWIFFQLSLEISGWTAEAVWLGPGWMAGLVLGFAALVFAFRSGTPRTGAFIFLGMFLLWLSPLFVVMISAAG